jgi:uncharacterized protein
MKLEQSFEVSAPLERVWEALIDVERVAPCLPGAAVTGRNDDGSYNGTFKVKIGPTSASYSGKLAMEQVDETAHTATMEAKGSDKRGQGGASATIVSALTDTGNGSTRVEVVTDYHINGKLARFGRGGMIEDISNKLLGDFAKCLQTSLAGAPAEAVPAPEPAAAPELAAVPEPAAAVEEAPAAVPSGDGAEAAAPPPPPPPPHAVGPEAAAPPPPPPAAAAPPPPPPPAAAVPPPLPPVVESEPVHGLSLVGTILWGRVKRNPAPFVALVLGFLLALRVLRRRS